MDRSKSIILAAISIALTFTFTSCAPSLQSHIADASAAKATEEAKSSAEEGRKIQEALEEACREIMLQEIDCIVGVGESSSEAMARKESAFNARIEYANSIKTRVQSETEQTARNVNKEAQISLEEKASARAFQTISGATPYITKSTFDGKYYKVYTLMVVNPQEIKEIIEVAAKETGDEAVMEQVKSPEVQDSLSKKISAFKDVVLPILETLRKRILGI